MFVYIWKAPDGVPFYVGIGGTLARANPKGYRSRNRFCREAISRIGVDNVVVEIHSAPTDAAAKEKEQALILEFGTRTAGTGPLTNISKGGERHETTDKTRKTLADRWVEPDAYEKFVAPRIGAKRNLPESTKTSLRASLAANEAMKPWGERNGKDPEFDAKRIAGIKAAQPKRKEKMSDPAALAQRKERLRATLNSPEYKARRAAQNTPEYRANMAAKQKARWAAKKAALISPEQS